MVPITFTTVYRSIQKREDNNMEKAPIELREIPESVNAFMLAEFNALSENRRCEIQRGQVYVNIYLLLTSGVAGFLTVMVQISKQQIDRLSEWLLFLLFFLGTITFIRVIARGDRIIKFNRAMNRIRRYFVGISPIIQDYVFLPINDPSYIRKGFERIGLQSVVGLINSGVGTTLVYLIQHEIKNYTQRIIISAIVFIGLLSLHELYIWLHSVVAEKKKQVAMSENDKSGG